MNLYLCVYVCVYVCMYNVCLYHVYIRDVWIGRRIVMINDVIGVAFDWIWEICWWWIWELYGGWIDFVAVQGEWTWLESTSTMKVTRCCQWRYGKTRLWRFGSTMREKAKRFLESQMLVIRILCVRIPPILIRYNTGDQFFLAVICVCL